VSGGSDKTEKATPKKLADARKKGQVARSADLNGAAILLAGLMTLSLMGPAMWERTLDATRNILVLVASPDVVDRQGIGEILGSIATSTALTLAPVALACALAGLGASVAQVGFKPSPEALKADPKRLNPISGAKNLFGMRAVFETFKNVVKVAVVGAIAALAVFPKLDELASLVGMPPAELLSTACHTVFDIAIRATAGYAVIAMLDYAYQKYDFLKKNKMEKKEVKDEAKSEGTPQEVKTAQRRRQMQAATARMMDAVPTADVVVMNPTHYAVALKYDSSQPAPVCVAKGQDHLALRMRAIAEEAGVTVVVEPPLARSLHGVVEVGRMIPEDTFQAVAQLLAYVYRVAGARKRGAA
jgi:flagellar biosynthetic protein FlhB